MTGVDIQPCYVYPSADNQACCIHILCFPPDIYPQKKHFKSPCKWRDDAKRKRVTFNYTVIYCRQKHIQCPRRFKITGHLAGIQF